jgi:hypothetical protein
MNGIDIPRRSGKDLQAALAQFAEIANDLKR